MANHKQAKKRARQSENRRQRNIHVKTGVRSRIKRVRYSIGAINHLDSGRQVHPQEVEKHLKSILEHRAADYERFKSEDILVRAKEMLADGGPKKRYDRALHRTFLQDLARTDMHIAERELAKAASRGVLHSRNASRRISRLHNLVSSTSK